MNPSSPPTPEAIAALTHALRDARSFMHVERAEVADMIEALAARLAEVVGALEPFYAYASLPSFDKMPADFPITQGSRMAAKQITAGDFQRLRAIIAKLETKP